MKLRKRIAERLCQIRSVDMKDIHDLFQAFVTPKPLDLLSGLFLKVVEYRESIVKRFRLVL